MGVVQLGGGSLWLAGLNTAPLNVIKRELLGATLSHERMYLNLEQALEAYQQSMDQGTSNG